MKKLQSISEAIKELEFLEIDSAMSINIDKNNLNCNIIIAALNKFIYKTPKDIEFPIQIQIQGIGMLQNIFIIEHRDVEYYLKMIDKAETIKVLSSICAMARSGLKVGDKVQWENGRIGVIVEPVDAHNYQIYYRLLKKNGEVGAKEFILYGKTKEYNYKKIE